MEYGRITPKQREILEYIKQEILNRGYPPTVRELCDAVHLKSTSSIHSHLESLEKNGYIRRDPSKPRAIEIVDDSFNLTRREMVNVPIHRFYCRRSAAISHSEYRDLLPDPCRIHAKSGYLYAPCQGRKHDQCRYL